MLKTFFTIFFSLLLIFVLIIYFFGPFTSVEFSLKEQNSNFTSNFAGSSQMQFYENMRFPESEISYRIQDCSTKKIEDMERAFEIIEEETILEFYPVLNNEEIIVTCDSTQKTEGGLFIAGEGGPTNISKAGNFNVITSGKILLIRDSECQKPNVAIHELLHVLGFDHSSNENNIMYNISKCSQGIGDDTINLINELYSLPSYADLVLEKVVPELHGKYLDVNISIRNNGFKASEKTNVKIYADGKYVEEVEIASLDTGFGVKSISKNININQLSVNELRFVIDSDFEELNKENNELVFEIKK